MIDSNMLISFIFTNSSTAYHKHKCRYPHKPLVIHYDSTIPGSIYYVSYTNTLCTYIDYHNSVCISPECIREDFHYSTIACPASSYLKHRRASINFTCLAVLTVSPRSILLRTGLKLFISSWSKLAQYSKVYNIEESPSQIFRYGSGLSLPIESPRLTKHDNHIVLNVTYHFSNIII